MATVSVAFANIAELMRSILEIPRAESVEPGLAGDTVYQQILESTLREEVVGVSGHELKELGPDETID